jgi:Bifunctional DNA primase/polymerase, N-terminal/Primase C terminal 1 (PriCT-1)
VDGGRRAALFAEHARRYAELGWALIRLNGKKPKTERWEKEPPGPAELMAGKWSHWGARYDMGVVLGTSRPPLAVVEPDTKGALELLLELLGGRLPHVPIVRSGGKSLHLYFLDEGHGNTSVGGLELRAGAQQCVIPPSNHPETGRPYIWLEGHEPWTAPIGPIPDALLAHFAGMLFTAKRPAAPVEDEIPEGSRHRKLLSLAGTMRRRGLGEAEIAAALQETNRLRCKPPLPEDEVVALVADMVRRYQPAPPDPEREQLEREADRLFAAWGMSEEAPPRGRARRPTIPLIVSLVEFLGGDEDDAAWLVDHLAARGALVLVAGLPKVGKSTFVYGMLGALTGGDDA